MYWLIYPVRIPHNTVQALSVTSHCRNKGTEQYKQRPFQSVFPLFDFTELPIRKINAGSHCQRIF